MKIHFETGESPSSITSYMMFYPTTSKIELAFKGVRSFDGVLLWCLSQKEAEDTLKEVHANPCGAHQAGQKLHDQIRRLGYYWPTMIADSIQLAKKYRECQIHGDYIH